MGKLPSGKYFWGVALSSRIRWSVSLIIPAFCCEDMVPAIQVL
jgi:hypothetical protein